MATSVATVGGGVLVHDSCAGGVATAVSSEGERTVPFGIGATVSSDGLWGGD